jgi:hypothetical protein
MRGSGLSTASIIAASAALGSWGLAAASAYAAFDPRGLAIEVGAGTTSSLIAVMCWLTRGLLKRDDARYRQLDGEYRRREAALIKTVARLSGYPTPTQPLPRLRPVRR